jgi:predicted site-specific integrase-resolvase
LPRVINEETYYTTIEICREAGISRSTLLRWLKNGAVNNVPHRDRRGWRVFSGAEVKRIKEEANRLK